MKALILIAILSTAYGCGSSVGGPADASTDAGISADSVAKIDTGAKGDTPPQPDVDITAKFYATEAELPNCDQTTVRELVYVKETTQFEYCDAVAGWTPIDLKGPKGDPGKNGKDGIAGKDGTNGRDGTKGVAGNDGSTQIWVHPINNSKWFLGAAFKNSDLVNASEITQLCPAGSRLPTEEEYLDAVDSGIWNQFGTLITAHGNKILIEEEGSAPNFTLKFGFSNGSASVYTVEALGTYISLSTYSICTLD